MRRRERDRSYRAVRVEPRQWDLHVDGSLRSSHRGFRDAERAAVVIDRRSRTRAAAVRHTTILVAAFLVLTPVLLLREIDNPNYEPAREFADQIESAYRAISANEIEIADLSLDSDGFEGGVFTIDRGGIVADYLVLTGEHEGDCYVVRWQQGRVPFVGRLLPRDPCVPGDPALSFNPADFEALANNTSADGPLDWSRVLPPQTRLGAWVLPAVIALLYVALQQLVSLSLIPIRGVPRRPLEVERFDETG